MRLRRYREPAKLSNPPVLIGLVEYTDGVNVVTRSEGGLQETLLFRISPTGRIIRSTQIPARYGFDLDDKGRIKLE